MKEKTYLLTGGTGFIGSALVKRLVALGRKVRVVDNNLRGRAERLSGVLSDVEFIEADVRDEAAMIRAGKGADVILHLAALNGTENFYKRPELVLDVGIRGMYAMLASARANGIVDFVLASSSEAYQTAQVIPTPENVPLMIPDPWNPRYSYGGSKIASEIMLANYNQDIFKRATIFRPHNVYGPDMGWEHVLPQLILRAHDLAIRTANGEKIDFEIQGDGTQTRSFIHVDDFIDGLMLVIDGGQHRKIYHIGTEEELSIKDVAQIVLERFGRDYRIVPTSLPEGGTNRRCPDITQLRKLGFAPAVELKDGIKPVHDWYVAHQHERP